MSFERVDECVLLEQHPCGCESDGHSLDLGVLAYQTGGLRVHPEDLEECRQCGAVWRLADRLENPPFVAVVAICTTEDIDETANAEEPLSPERERTLVEDVAAALSSEEPKGP